MRVLVIGATGRLGGEVVRELTARGHAVDALVRTEAAWPGVSVHRGDVRDAASLEAAIPGHDAVVSAWGPGRGGDPAVLSIGMANVAIAMEAAGVSRLVAVAAAGVLQRDAVTLRRDAPGYPEAFRARSAEHLKALETLQASGLDWTLVCPPELVPGDGAYRVEVDYLPEGPRRVALGAVARFIADELEAPRFVRRRVGIADG